MRTKITTFGIVSYSFDHFLAGKYVFTLVMKLLVFKRSFKSALDFENYFLLFENL